MKALEARTNAKLIAVILRLEEQVARLEKRVTDLEAENAKLRKNSSTSSKPPSSDIVKPPKTNPKGKRKKERRKIGGQKGHPKHERQPFAVEDLSDVWEYHLDRCPDCGGSSERERRFLSDSTRAPTSPCGRRRQDDSPDGLSGHGFPLRKADRHGGVSLPLGWP